jgi:hypothetical protein
MNLFSKNYEIPRADAARARCASSLPLNSTVSDTKPTSFTMLHVVTLALMAIGATAQSLDSMADHTGCVDQTTGFISALDMRAPAEGAYLAAGIPGPLITDCAGVASNGYCTIPNEPGHTYRVRRACPVACATPCLDSPTPLSPTLVDGMPEGDHTSWTCTQYAAHYGVTNGDCSLAAIKADPDCASDAGCANEQSIQLIWWMCPNKCGAPCAGSDCPQNVSCQNLAQIVGQPRQY